MSQLNFMTVAEAIRDTVAACINGQRQQDFRAKAAGRLYSGRIEVWDARTVSGTQGVRVRFYNLQHAQLVYENSNAVMRALLHAFKGYGIIEFKVHDPKDVLCHISFTYRA